MLLNLSHATNLLWSWQVQLVLSTVIVAAVILVIVSRAAWPSPRTALAVGVGLACLCLCGANGVAVVPALDCWLLAASLAHWNSGLPFGRRRALTVLMAAVPGIVLTILYFTGYHSSDRHPTTAELELAVRTSLQFISLMFGTQARVLWPASGLAALSVIASSALILVYAAIKGPAEERSCALGLLCAFGGLACLAVGVGWGRAGSGDLSGFEPRYITLVAPIWVAVIFTWDIFTPPVVRRVALTTALAAALILLWPTRATRSTPGMSGHNRPISSWPMSAKEIRSTFSSSATRRSCIRRKMCSPKNSPCSARPASVFSAPL